MLGARGPSTSQQLHYREAATTLRMINGGMMGDARFEIGYQLPSLLARFQEMSSPMVELVLETGCL
jgi:hypothetical protein